MNISLFMARRQEEIRLTTLVAEIALEQGCDMDDRPHRGTPAGDERRLRGIPCVARGVPGAQAGSRPGDGLE